MRPVALAVLLALPACASHFAGEELEPDAPPPTTPPPVAIVPADRALPGPAPAPEPLDAASDCIADVVADAQSAWAAETDHPADAHAVIEAEQTEALGDLDGDGRRETVVVNEPLCGVTGNCPMRMYLSADGCSTLALDTFAAYVWRAEGKSHGARSIESWSNGGCAGMVGDWAAHRFDGTHYVVTHTVSCGCPDGEELGWPKETSRPAQCPG